MREIKFRAWIEEQEEIVAVAELIFEEGVVMGAILDSEHEVVTDYIGDNEEPMWDNVPYYNCAEFILMQFTGLKDKNGVEIYEGDILRFTHREEPYVYKVAFIGGCFDVVDPSCCKVCASGHGSHGSVNEALLNPAEVIGNIHQNPDLLEGERT